MSGERILLVGAGHVSQYHLGAWAGIADTEVVGIVDPARDRAEAQAGRFGIGKVYESIDDALGELEVDVVDIATPPATHADVLQAVFRHGVDAICQKPLAADFGTAVEVARRAEASTSLVMVNDNWRYRSWYRRLRAMVADGRLGEVFHVSSSARFAGTIPSSTYPEIPFSLGRQPYFAELEQFLLLESTIHQIDAVRSLIGSPDTVYARAHSVAPEVVGEDAVALMLGYGNATALIDRSYASHTLDIPPVASERVRVEGTEGTAIIDELGGLVIINDQPAGRRVETITAEPDAYARSYSTAFRHFLDARKGAVALGSTVGDALETLAVVFAGYRSIDDGGAIRIDDLATAYGWERP
ncbi:Gfo/Idh/MocA family protein [Arthrobacter sp. NPDC055138]